MTKRKRYQMEIGSDVILSIMLAVIFVVVAFWCSYAVSQTIDRSTHDIIVESFEDQIALLKWIGLGVIGALASVIVRLWVTTMRQQKLIVDEVKHAAESREKEIIEREKDREATDRLTDAIDRLEKKIEQCPVSKEWAEFNARR